LACVDALLGKSQSSLDYLHKAVQAGYRDVDHMETDPDLASLRNCDEFQSILTSLKLNDQRLVEEVEEEKPREECPWSGRFNGCGRAGFWRGGGGGGGGGRGRGCGRFRGNVHRVEKLMSIGDLEGARSLLQQQLVVIPNHPLALYNMACVEALLGNKEEALAQLNCAITAGFDQVSNMVDNKYLVSLHDSVQFWNLVTSLQARLGLPITCFESPSVANIPVVAVEPVPPLLEEPTTEIVPVEVQDPVNEAFRQQLAELESFGFTDRKLNTAALDASNGSLPLAVGLLLDGFAL